MAVRVATLKEHWTRKGGRIEVKHPEGTTTFEFDDSQEQRDQLRNAYFHAQDLLDQGKINILEDHIFKRFDQYARRLTKAIVGGQINMEGM